MASTTTTPRRVGLAEVLAVHSFICVLMPALTILGLITFASISANQYLTEKHKEKIYEEGWCEVYGYDSKNNDLYYQVYIYDFDPSFSTSTSTSVSSTVSTSSLVQPTSTTHTDTPTTSSNTELSTTPNTPTTTTDTHTTTTTTPSQDGDTPPLSPNFLDTGKIRYSTSTNKRCKLLIMAEKRPLGGVATCWFSPDNPGDEPSWNEPNSEYYEKLTIGLWAVLIGAFVLLCSGSAVLVHYGARYACVKLKCGGPEGMCGSCQCETSKLLDCCRNLWNRCCGGWQRFQDEDVSPDFPL
eukprot:CAMPEP_0174261682 /NCGR_PEP_ID=MMETSP0439-20130205/11813_1 /TAXON_ID=0 /ORGANISM="Stereomyxa ramosa, Strain Chinc5" /LENGTH=296 /DNA_ID=CAMNT_0015346209 /DNA_START=38 /DNA_END=928 /DNA_ORIENTATION=+